MKSLSLQQGEKLYPEVSHGEYKRRECIPLKADRVRTQFGRERKKKKCSLCNEFNADRSNLMHTNPASASEKR